MFKIVNNEDSFEVVVDSTAEAVELSYTFNSHVKLLNRLKKGFNEAQRIIHSRVATMDAPDAWPGARFEEDLVPLKFVRPYGQAGRMAWPQKVKVDQVRA